MPAADAIARVGTPKSKGRYAEKVGANKEISLTGRTVADFWVWAYSDVLTNIPRAVLAEWIVGTALDATDGMRSVWDYYDLTIVAPGLLKEAARISRTGSRRR